MSICEVTQEVNAYINSMRQDIRKLKRHLLSLHGVDVLRVHDLYTACNAMDSLLEESYLDRMHIEDAAGDRRCDNIEEEMRSEVQREVVARTYDRIRKEIRDLDQEEFDWAQDHWNTGT